MSGRLGEVERKLRRAADEAAELRKEIRMAFGMVPNVGRGAVCLTTFNFTVTDASTHNPVAGAVVVLTSSGGSAVASGTTDGSGLLTLTADTADTFSYTVTVSGYTTATGAAASSCGSVVAVPVALGTAGVAAWGCTGVPTALQVADTLYGFSGVTLTYNGSTAWTGCVVVNYVHPAGVGCTSGTVPLFLTLNKSGASPLLTVRYKSTSGGGAGDCPVVGITCAATPDSVLFSGSTSVTRCSPLLITFHLAAAVTQFALNPGTADTFTVTP